MGKLLALFYALAVYALFGATWAYFVAFVGGFVVPKTVDSGPVGGAAGAAAIDLGLLALFFAHHSVMARARTKRALTRLLPAPVERSTYVLVSCLALALLMWQWRPLPGVVWQATGAARAAVLGVFGVGVATALVASHTLDGLELFGVRQALAHFRGRVMQHAPFRVPGLYRLVRHPMMTGIALTLWAAPTMTEGRLLLTAVMTGYIVLAVKLLEERDLRRTFGAEYARYQREVPMLLPLKLPVKLPRRAST
jgi:methanethiol S-methyltransferase